MPVITILPHAEYCPEGGEVSAPLAPRSAKRCWSTMLPIEHACDQVCACTTCHVIVRAGARSLSEMEGAGKTCWTAPGAWSLIRACPARPSSAEPGRDEIPKYSINHAKERN